ncbi:uncharacterized protein LODBEIA_P39930 [Lodderomyces beijingensis]|uniref:Prefoldin subunit 4 n=1 Tax=Lodderomyces beijingensis TaxID=1775926 RepID=A0ABP0ZPC7_9ASCO
MELLPEGQRNTATEVEWSDQQKINKFSRLVSKQDKLQHTLVKYKQEKEYLDDLQLELELLDEDESIQYKVGDFFLFMRVSEALDKIESDDKSLSGKIESVENELEQFEDELASLKKELYAKFGKNINLER